MTNLRDKETIKLAKKFLTEIYNHSPDLSLSSTSGNENILGRLIELLENKEDPDSTELYLIESLYQYLEKLSILENHLKKYIKGYNHKTLIGNKLDDLYDNRKGYGSSKLFD